MSQKKQINELFIVREALAILGVIMVHATSYATVELATSSSLYPLYNFLNRFSPSVRHVYFSERLCFILQLLQQGTGQAAAAKLLSKPLEIYCIALCHFFPDLLCRRRLPPLSDNNSFSGLSRDFC